MKLIDVAKEFADLNTFNKYTRSSIISIAKIFSERAGITLMNQIDFTSIAEFKRRTLDIVKPVTYNGYLKYLRILGDYAMLHSLLDRNYFREIKLAPLGVPPPKIITQAEVRSIHRYLLDNQELHKPYWFWLCVIYCLYYTGMRRRQLVSLRMRDIDLEKKTILLSCEGSKTKRQWTIPMHDQLVKRFREYFIQAELTLDRKLKKDEFVFDVSKFNCRYTKAKDGGLTAEAVTGFFKRLAAGSEISIGAHRFRHTFATALCNPMDDSPPDILLLNRY